MFETTLVLLGGSIDFEPLIGAFEALESSSLGVSRIVATSTMSIFAALRSTGYDLPQIRHGWEQFLERSRGRVLEKYNLDAWLGGLLQQRGVRTFGDLRNRHETFHQPELKVIVKDKASQRLLTLPDDAGEIGVDADSIRIVSAVHASLNIPGMSRPERIGQRDLVSVLGPVQDISESVWNAAGRPWKIYPRSRRPIYLYVKPAVQTGMARGVRDRFRAAVSPKYRSILATEMAITNALKDTEVIPFEGEGFLEEAAPERYLELQALPHALAGPSMRQPILENAREQTQLVVNNLIQDLSVSTSPTADLQPRQFFFILEGEKVDHDQIVYGADFDLVFNYDVPPDSALAVIHGKKLIPEGRIQIVIFLSGFELRDGGSTWGVAEFEKGKLKEPVRFLLKAPASDQGQARIDIIFSVKGARTYELPLHPRLVTQIEKSSNPRRPLDVDLDELTAKDRAQRDAELYIDDKDGAFLVTFVYKSRGEPAKVVSDFNTSQLETELSLIRGLLKDVAGHAIWNNIGPELQPPSNKGELRKQMDKVLEAGSRLHSLFVESGFKDIIERIDGLDDGSTVSICTKSAFMPFELMYPPKYAHEWSDNVPQRAANFQPEKLWGCRFQLETLPLPVSQRAMPRPQQTPPVSVSMAVGKTVAAESESGKEAIGWQRTYFDTKLMKFGRFLTERDDIEPIFTKSDVATFIYLLCHGQSKNPAQQADAILEFDKDFLVTPNTLITENAYASHPIVFLNSCSSGAISPLSFFSFLKEFRKKGAIGLIATSCAIPTRFAAAFGERLLDGYLDRQPIGKVLLNARRPLILDHVPLGVLYTLQCPLDVLGPANVTA